MKKTAILLVVMLVVSILALSSCELIGKIPFIGDLINKPCEEHVDENGDYICDRCDAELEKDTPPPCEHKDENKDHSCDLCETKLSECADADTDHKCDVCGTDMGEHAAAEGSHNCAYCGKAASECADADTDYKCDVCGKEMLPDNMERISYAVDIGELETGVSETDVIAGKFIIVAGTEIRSRTKNWTNPDDSSDTRAFTKSVKFGSNSNAIKVSVPGSGVLVFWAQNGSSSADTQKVKIISPDGKEQIIEFAGNTDGSPVVKLSVDVTEGDWTIQRGQGNTVDIYALELSCIVEKSEENGFEIVSNGTVDYLCGQKLDLSGLRLNATYANGKTEPLALEDVTVDTSLVDLSKSGTYEITVSYKEYTPIKYNVNVYLPESVTLGLDAVEKLAQNSAAGNGVYFNYSFKEVYKVGDTLDLTGLSVIVNGSLGETKKSFNVGDNFVTSEVDLSSAGVKAINVDYVFGESKVSAVINVYVVDAEPSIVNDIYQVKVDQSYNGTIGAVVDGYNTFTTIEQALNFLANTDANKQKLMYIAPGLYKEKLEITVPNLHIYGAGADKVMIEWDSLYGLKDAGGFTHTTDSTATVAIRDGAYGCTIENVTISNAFNSKEYFDKTLGENYPEHRALALLVMGDRFIMKNSVLLGYQDTVELFTGRQYFKNVEIHGYTDFIFGTNNTTLFEDCLINTIYSGKSNGGYLTAFKGSNKGAADAITYGAIFYHCEFTADEGVADGLTAIGRPWGAYAAVAVIECELGAHIATTASGTASQNERYVIMSGVKPTDETVQFVEYNNTGAGAITEAVAGMRFLTAEEAAKYVDFEVIFGKLNNKVAYDDPWDPNSTEIKIDDRTYYFFDQGSSTTGNSNTLDTTTKLSGTTLDWAGLHISAENGNVAWNQNANALNMKQGAFIKFTVPAGSEVTVKAFSGYQHFTTNGVGTAAATLSQYFAEETEVVVMSIGDCYLYSIIINPNEEAPAAPTLSEIKVSGVNTNYVVGDEISFEGVEVKAYYSDNSVRTIPDYTVDSSAVDNTAAGEYEVVFSYGGKTASVKVTYEDPNAAPEITKNTYLDFKNEEGYNAVVNNQRVTLSGSFRANGAEYQITGTISFPVKAGTIVTVIPYGNSSYVAYTIGAEGDSDLATLTEGYSYVATKDCTVVYTGLSNNYLVGIQIDCPIADGKYVFGGSSEEGDVTGILASGDYINVSGTCKTHSGGAQLSSDSKISFIVPAFANVTIKGFDTSYGQLNVMVGGEKIEMDDKACYVFSTTAPKLVEIAAVNVGTEEAPAWNKSYITYIEVDIPACVEETTEITFGSEGNYKDSVIDFSGITIADNGGSNSQIKNGSFVFIVKAGATVTVHGYPGYTSYTFNGGAIITDENYIYTAENDELITIAHSEGNNYFYSISIVYPVVYDESTTIDLSATNGAHIEGSVGSYEGLSVDATNGKFADNGSGWTQVTAGTIIKLNVAEGATVSATTYQNAEIFTIEIADGVCTLTCTANGYISSISVYYPIVYDENTTIDLSATNGAHIEGSVGSYEGLSVDATSGKFADNGSGWTQVTAGTIIKLNVAEGATVSAKTYQDAEIFTIEIADGVCTLTCTANGYIGSITIAY